jgi:hypothetical protein
VLPGLLLVGLAAGLIARRTPLWLPIAMGVVWAVVIAADVSTDSGTLAMAAVLGVANTSVGLLVGRAFRGAEGIART